MTEAISAELDARFVLVPMPAEFVKGIAEPVVTYAVREGPSAVAPSAEEETDDRHASDAVKESLDWNAPTARCVARLLNRKSAAVGSSRSNGCRRSDDLNPSTMLHVPIEHLDVWNRWNFWNSSPN